MVSFSQYELPLLLPPLLEDCSMARMKGGGVFNRITNLAPESPLPTVVGFIQPYQKASDSHKAQSNTGPLGLIRPSCFGTFQTELLAFNGNSGPESSTYTSTTPSTAARNRINRNEQTWLSCDQG
jgi:hypothetical protein